MDVIARRFVRYMHFKQGGRGLILPAFSILTLKKSIMLTLTNYSEKAIAVIGDTKTYKDELKAAGGRFNAKLTCGPGWIFSRKAEAAVLSIIAKANGEGTPSAEPVADPLSGARVYVGTYAKYNSGSLNGKWLTLSDYKDRSEFYAACRELHKDEADPEFMFQDWEGVPSWMIGESHIDAEVWNQQPEKESKGSQSKAEIRAILETVLPDGRDIDYYVRETAAIVKAGGRYFDIDKPRIETRFCMDDESPNLEEWRKAVRTYEFFKNENLAHLDSQIEALETGKLGEPIQLAGGEMGIMGLFVYKANNGLWSFGKDSDRYYLTKESEAVAMDEETRKALLKGYKAVRTATEKRLAAWWKKYGPDKLHCWTYWANA